MYKKNRSIKMTDIYMFDDSDLQDKVKELKKELKQIKDDKFRGELDLEKQIDTLKTQLDLKDLEIEMIRKKYENK
tara:strand:- start:457 stop:681 length:225 start_codon:yes stop_codon:yes gene_type:complete